MLIPLNGDQDALRGFHGRLRWQRIRLTQHPSAHRRMVRDAILIALALQYRLKRIYVEEVLRVLGPPDQYEGRLAEGLLFYTYWLPQYPGSGLHGVMLCVSRSVVHQVGSNRMDLFTGRITRRHRRPERSPCHPQIHPGPRSRIRESARCTTHRGAARG